MHISEGVLSGQVLLSGGILAGVGTAIGLKKMDYDRIAQVGILSNSSIFVFPIWRHNSSWSKYSNHGSSCCYLLFSLCSVYKKKR